MEFIEEFEQMRDDAELNALSKESLRRRLNQEEFTRFKELANRKLYKAQRY